jgi:hypothetical protein
LSLLQRLTPALAAIVVAFGTFVASGFSPLYKNEGLGLSFAHDASSRTLTVSRDGANLDCWMRIEIPPTHDTLASAKLSNGEVADVRSSADGRWLFISGRPAKDQKWPQMLPWTSGLSLEISPVPAIPAAWDVYPREGKPDSNRAATFRSWLVVLAALTLVLSVLLAVFAALPKKEAPAARLSGESIIDAFKGEIEGKSEKETEIMRRYVAQAAVVGAAAAMAILATAREKRLALDALVFIRARFEKFIKDLEEIRTKFQ